LLSIDKTFLQIFNSMIPADLLQKIRASMPAGKKITLLAYGSSNTERFLPGMHWFDILELALRDTHGRFHQCVNTGVSGDTSRGLLNRFDQDAAGFSPCLAIITIRGNDSNADSGIPVDEFSENLVTLHKQFAAIKCATIFQTYYSPDPAQCGDLTSFYDYMERVRRTARDLNAPLVDHLRRWEAFRLAHPARYARLMQDGFHLNRHGNAVLGLDLARAFGANLAMASDSFWDEALEIQGLMDALH